MQSDVTWEQLEHLARREGLDMVGVVPAGPAPTWDVYRQWLAQGYAGDMTYLTRPDALSQRADPRTLMPSARSVLIVGTGYAGPSHPSLLPLHGRVSRYAWQEEDYHRWLLRQLKALVGRITEGQAAATSRCYVDTGPVLERAWAQAAGLGWFGKHSNLIHPRLGSYVFLGVALLDVDLPSTPAIEMPGCGACTRCIEACPTGAIIAPGVVDARRCLSYLTIENRGPIPEALRAAVGSWVFGCDVCQEVCPWNRKPRQVHGGAAVPACAQLFLPDLLSLDKAAFRARFRHLPLWRATPEGLARNAAVVLGNLGDRAALPFLEQTAASHPSALVREHAGWAIDQIIA